MVSRKHGAVIKVTQPGSLVGQKLALTQDFCANGFALVKPTRSPPRPISYFRWAFSLFNLDRHLDLS
jgi:hypothetical protein